MFPVGIQSQVSGSLPHRPLFGVRRQTIASFILHRPIFDFCVDGTGGAVVPALTRFGGSNRWIWIWLKRRTEAEASETGSEEEDGGSGLDN
jgi:hypothetical protein